MLWITVETEHYILRARPVLKAGHDPDLYVILERNPKYHHAGVLTIEATIVADRVVEWIIGQLVQAEFFENVPGVTILSSPLTES